jgi:hypothetical protein
VRGLEKTLRIIENFLDPPSSIPTLNHPEKKLIRNFKYLYLLKDMAMQL